MTQLRLTLLLLQPSLLSLSVSVIGSVLFLVGVNWAFVANNDAVYDYFFSEHGLVTVLQNSPQGFTAMLQEVLARPTTRDLLSFGFIFVLGALVYLVLSLLNALFSGALGTWADWRTLPGLRRQVHSEVWQRLLFRLVILVLWLTYTWVFLRLVVPYSVSSSRFGIATAGDVSGWGYFLAGFGVLLAALHLHVIFIRLLTLRPRLFLSTDVALEDEITHRRSK